MVATLGTLLTPSATGLTPSTTGEDAFALPNAKGGWVSLYGGQIVAQALAAASATVSEDRQVHSLHAYFLRPGQFDASITARVERERDGASFSGRRAIVHQNGKPILTMTASYHTSEAGPSRDLETMPDAPDPETLEPLEDVSGPRYGRNADDPSPLTYVDVRPVQGCRPFEKRPPEPPFGMMWMKLRGGSLGSGAQDRAAVAYLSDLFLINAAMSPDREKIGKGAMLTSLDHAVWFHDAPDADDWMLYVQSSPWAGEGRALCRGSIFARDGRHVASIAQEVLLRLGTR